MTDIGRVLVVLGVVFILAGVVLVLFGKIGFPLGRLPGDIVYRGKNTTFYFPIVTSILLSALVSVVMYLIGRR